MSNLQGVQANVIFPRQRTRQEGGPFPSLLVVLHLHRLRQEAPRQALLHLGHGVLHRVQAVDLRHLPGIEGAEVVSRESVGQQEQELAMFSLQPLSFLYAMRGRESRGKFRTDRQGMSAMRQFETTAQMRGLQRGPRGTVLPSLQPQEDK
jgi:hypothetical protein